MFDRIFHFDLQRFNSYYNTSSWSLVSGTSANDSFYNSGGYATVDCGDGSDSVVNRGSNVSISGGAGNDVFDMDPYYVGIVDNVTLTGGAGNDTFVFDPYYANTISAVITDFTSDDIFVFDSDFNSGGTTLSYTTENGNVVLRNSDSSTSFIVTLQGVSNISQIANAKYYRYTGWGGSPQTLYDSTTFGEYFGVPSSVYVSNSTSNTVINGSDSDDSIMNYAGNVTINTGAGNDTIDNEAIIYNVSVNGGADNDSIRNFARQSTILGGDGNDTIHSWGATSSKIDGGAGNDKILNGWCSDDDVGGINSTLIGGAGDDSFANWSNYVTISGGSGNDTINNDSDYVSISGGTGNDIISLTSNAENNFISYSYGDGNDTVYNFDSNDTLGISGATYSTTKSGDDLIVSVTGSGTITLKDAVSISANINGTPVAAEFKFTSGNDYYSNSTSSTLLSALAGKDTIYNDNYTYRYVTIDGGAGNDVIMNKGDYASINGGAGNDKISITASGTWSNTIKGGKGNDTIYSNARSSSYGHTYQYAKGDGNDVIYSFGSADTLNILGATYSTTKSGSDMIVSVTGSGKITLKNAANDSVNIIGTVENQNTWTLSGTTAKYGTSSKTLVTVKGVKSLDGISLEDDVVTVSEASLNQKKVTISGTGYTLALDDDVTKTKTTAAGWSVSGTTATYKTKKVTAGYALASNKKSISYSAASGGATKVTLSGLKSGTKASYLTLKNNVVTIGKNAIGTGKITAKGDGYKFVLGSSGKLTYSGSKATLQGSTGKDTLVGGAKADVIVGGKGNDSLVGGKGNDTLTGGVGNDTLTGGAGNDIFIYTSGDGNDKITDFSATDTLRIGDGTGTYSTQKSGSNIIVNVGEGAVTLVGATKLSKVNIVGNKKDDGVKYSNKKVTITDDYENESFALTGEYKSALTVDASAAVIDLEITGNDKANKIIGSAQKDTLDGGKGNDTLIGGKGNDVLIGGEGDDVFVYKKGDGNDKILDYAEDDLISITGDSVKSITAGENDVVFTLGKGKITLQGAADKVISYEVNGDEKTYSILNSKFVTFNKKGTSVTLNKNYPITTFMPSLYSDYADLATVNASKVQHAMNIVGNGKANKITGGTQNDTIDGGAGNDSLIGGVGSDTLKGGKGDDKLWGNDGNDVFLYASGDGNDTIFDYDSSVDKIVLTSGKVNNVAADENNNVIFTIGTGQIILANAKGKYAEIVNSSGKVLKQYNP